MTEIITAVQRGSQGHVYGPNQRQLCAVFAGNGPKDGLQGYTSSTVSVRRGNMIYVYNAKGSQFLTLSAGDGIVGFTQSTVSIRRGSFIYTYNAKGSQVSVIPAGN